MKKSRYIVGVFILGCLLGYYYHYSQVSDRIVLVGELSLEGEFEGWLQSNPQDGTVIGVQLYNGTGDHIVVTAVVDSNGETAEFTQIYMAKPLGRGYLSAGRAVPLDGIISNRVYAVILPGDNAVLKFDGGATGPVQVQYYAVGDERWIELEQIETLWLE